MHRGAEVRRHTLSLRMYKDTFIPEPFNQGGFPSSSVRKESACDAGDPGSIPGLGRSPGEGSTHSSILAWKILWTEEPGGLHSMGLQESDTT